MVGFCAWGSVVIDETMFPDDEFRAYVLSADVSIDKDQDGTLSDAEISEVTEIDVNYMGISSLKGIEYFKALMALGCSRNQLTELDVSKNTKLVDLHCHTNNISSLNLSNNLALMRLICYSNNLMKLDVSSNTKLVTLDCYNNALPFWT